MFKEKIMPLTEEEKQKIEKELEEKEKLEEEYGKDRHAEKRERKKHQEKYEPTGGTLGAQKKIVEACGHYARKKRKSVE